jgi:hypothetical protein
MNCGLNQTLSSPPFPNVIGNVSGFILFKIRKMFSDNIILERELEMIEKYHGKINKCFKL